MVLRGKIFEAPAPGNFCVATVREVAGVGMVAWNVQINRLATVNTNVLVARKHFPPAIADVHESSEIDARMFRARVNPKRYVGKARVELCGLRRFPIDPVGICVHPVSS
jgi:hypothetical protein